MYEHSHGWNAFTARYRINRLVYYEVVPHPMSAIRREKQLKRLLRRQKIELIESGNPAWIDLAEGWSIGQRLSESTSLSQDSRSSGRESAGG